MATTLETKLAEAEKALHDLTIGKSAVDVWDGDFRVTYTPAKRDLLETYIAGLKAEISPAACLPTRRPLTFVF